MKKALLTALAIATVSAPMVAAPAADAQRRDRDYQWHGDRDDWDASRDYRRGNYRERRLSREDQVYRGRDGRSYCRRNDGTTGLVVGGAGGALLGNLVGGGLLGTLAGGGAGALLGREIDRGKVRCR
ncbi:glycine zipper 2TM domain-containing protein [uncultured Sphingomonas sp.]|uniref:glycine zipper 2TM domain-containing protein n=1 Tax=uncultured Sphingomonas sp. TaxID=158754 RepID=UPI0025F2986F|nr:glycine zipper 2TM domain-containing protein [uncultured Sphingomonas sp.]